MTVAYVCADPGVPIFGSKGCSIHVQEVVRALRRRGLEVEIHAARLGGSAPAELSDVPVFRFGESAAQGTAAREAAALAANESLVASLASRPGYEAIYERHSLFSDAAMHFARSHDIPGVLEVNAPLVEEQSRHRSLQDRAEAERRAASAIDAASLVVAVSEEVADQVTGSPAQRRRVCVVPNGVDTERFAGAAQAPRPNDPYTIVFLGTLRPWHGLPLLAEAFEILSRRDRRCRLLIVGDGPERHHLEEDLDRRDILSATHWVGRVPPSSVPSWLARAHVGLAPYPADGDFYFSPLKVFEYMAAGLPTVATAAGQLPSVIGHEVEGLLCPPGDAVAFADALDRLRCNPALRGDFGRRARATAVREHTWGAVVGTILERAGVTAGPLPRVRWA